MAIALVTGLFDIGRGGIVNTMFKRSFDEYKKYFQRLLVSTIETPLIIFCDPSLDDFIRDIRKVNYQIIHKTLADLRTLEYWDQVQTIIHNPAWYGQSGWLRNSPQYGLEYYTPLVLWKQYWMLEAVYNSAFAVDRYYWIDGGIAKLPDRLFVPLLSGGLEKRLEPYLDKMLYLTFDYRSNETHGFNQEAFDGYAKREINRVVKGGFFGGPPEYIRKIKEIYDDLLRITLNDGYLGTEENIFTLITYLYPELCHVVPLRANYIYNFWIDLLPEGALPKLRITGVHHCPLGAMCQGHIVGSA